MWAVSPGGICSVDGSEALSAWRYVSPARQSESGQCLVVCVPRQAILLQQYGVLLWTCVIYEVLVMP